MLRRIINAIACALAGHDWKFLRFGPRYRPEFHTTAHSDADCKRCGEQVRDASR